MTDRTYGIRRIVITTAIALPFVIAAAELYALGVVSGAFVAMAVMLVAAYCYASSQAPRAASRIWDQSALVCAVVLVSAVFLTDAGPETIAAVEPALSDPSANITTMDLR